MSFEVNLDGLVGPTHNYAGLAFGNIASASNAGSVSNPKKAALQGLAKMQLLSGLGCKQMIMPPQPRPDPRLLRSLGFRGSLRQQMTALANQAPELLPFLYSAAGMWAANSATICPSADAADGKIHITPANMIGTSHRAQEASFASRALKRLFPSEHFIHHDPLPSTLLTADEGAANHMRLIPPGGMGVHMFIYGRRGAETQQRDARFPARHSKEACAAVARLHAIPENRVILARQSQEAIDAGVFHNDVIATSNDHLLLYHEQAYAERDASLKALPEGLHIVKVPASRMLLQEATATYLFNSQIVTTANGMVMMAPSECEENIVARGLIDEWIADPAHPITQVHYMDLRESMRNGGGPACLRLRVPMNEAEWSSVYPGGVYTDTLGGYIKAWVEKHYRDRLTAEDLRDPAFAEEVQAALFELQDILKMPGLYDA